MAENAKRHVSNADLWSLIFLSAKIRSWLSTEIIILPQLWRYGIKDTNFAKMSIVGTVDLGEIIAKVYTENAHFIANRYSLW